MRYIILITFKKYFKKIFLWKCPILSSSPLYIYVCVHVTGNKRCEIYLFWSFSNIIIYGYRAYKHWNTKTTSKHMTIWYKQNACKTVCLHLGYFSGVLKYFSPRWRLKLGKRRIWCTRRIFWCWKSEGGGK